MSWWCRLGGDLTLLEWGKSSSKTTQIFEGLKSAHDSRQVQSEERPSSAMWEKTRAKTMRSLTKTETYKG